MNIPYFSEMANTTLSFEAFTRIWFLPVMAVPDVMKGDLKRIKEYAATAPQTIKMPFVGEVEILRGNPQTNPATGAEQIPMFVTKMEEFGYVPELDTTFKLSAQPNRESFGFTNQITKGFDAPANARLLLNLQIDAIQGQFKGVIVAKTCTTKRVAADIPTFPFTNGGTFFSHVGDVALEVGDPGSPIGYIIHGVMTPQLPTASPRSVNKSLVDLAYSKIGALSKSEGDFLNGVSPW